VRRQKNDAADAEAIAEAASRPTLRFVALKTEEQQARSVIFRTRDLLMRQRTQLANALRGHLAQHGVVAAQGLAQVKVLATALRDPGSLHPLVRELGQPYLDHIARLDVEIAELDKRLRRPSKDDETVKRLQSMLGMRPITAAAIEAFAPPHRAGELTRSGFRIQLMRRSAISCAPVWRRAWKSSILATEAGRSQGLLSAEPAVSSRAAGDSGDAAAARRIQVSSGLALFPQIGRGLRALTSLSSSGG
jgi:transposase